MKRDAPPGPKAPALFRAGFPWERCPACGVFQVWNINRGPVPVCMACDGIELTPKEPT